MVNDIKLPHCEAKCINCSIKNFWEKVWSVGWKIPFPKGECIDCRYLQSMEFTCGNYEPNKGIKKYKNINL